MHFFAEAQFQADEYNLRVKVKGMDQLQGVSKIVSNVYPVDTKLFLNKSVFFSLGVLRFIIQTYQNKRRCSQCQRVINLQVLAIH
jgi:hypothetical protein